MAVEVEREGSNNRRMQAKEAFLTVNFINKRIMGNAMTAPVGSTRPMAWPPANVPATHKTATFAAGCFWSPQLAFDRVPGVYHTAVGYTDGHVRNPRYEAVCSGKTGHTEAVQLTYDPQEVSFDGLCDTFFKKINPLQKNGQGMDWGSQYRTGIYYHDDEQKEVALRRVSAIPGCAVEVKAYTEFWPAEGYHQKYLERGGRNGRAQCAAKGCTDEIRCYG